MTTFVRPHHPGETVHDETGGLSLDYDPTTPGKIHVCMAQDGEFVGSVELTPAGARAFSGALQHWAANLILDEVLDPSYCSACGGPCRDES